MIVGIDIGYANVKVYTDGKQIIFPSVVGTGETSSFKVSGEDNAMQIQLDERMYNVGESALGGRSRFISRTETRDWYKTDEYTVLLHAALSELGKPDNITVVTGLPVSFFKQNKDKTDLKEKFQGIHHIYRAGRPVFTTNIQKCLVAPQPMGTLADVGLNEEGQISNADIATKHIGIIDIGGKTTNILHAEKMGDVDPSTDSFDIGGWDAVRAMRDEIENLCPDAGYEDHEISEAIRNGYILYRGNTVVIENELEKVLDPMADNVVSAAMQLWPGGGARLHTILISGGGANLIGDRIITKIPHGNIQIVRDSTFSNARGFYKLGKLKSRA